MNAKPGGLNATQTEFNLPNFSNSPSRSSFLTPSLRPPTYTRVPLSSSRSLMLTSVERRMIACVDIIQHD